VRVYLYSYAVDVTQAKSEAEHVIRLLKNKTLDYPVYYDLEDAGTTEKCSSAVIGDMAEVFCIATEAAGYRAGISESVDMSEFYVEYSQVTSGYTGMH
jgi:GH25 family lysozyme M1 (1,4-beta-N-acetylmuramidase)